MIGWASGGVRRNELVGKRVAGAKAAAAAVRGMVSMASAVGCVGVAETVCKTAARSLVRYGGQNLKFVTGDVRFGDKYHRIRSRMRGGKCTWSTGHSWEV